MRIVIAHTRRRCKHRHISRAAGKVGVGGAGCFRALHGLSRFLYLPIFDGFKCGDPVGRWQAEVMIQHMIKDGIEGAALLRIGQNHDAEIFLRHQHHAGNEARDPAVWPTSLRPR